MTRPDNPLLLDTAAAYEIAPGVTIIPDHFVPLVPNAAIIEGDASVLVFETGMGRANGERMLAKAREIADDRKLLLTLSHFHPEHAFGAQAFEEDAHIVYNLSQAAELSSKGASYVDLFRTFGADVADVLDGVRLVTADETYSGSLVLDLGGRIVELIEIGQAHTLGDQLVWLPRERIVFAGDLVESSVFPIFPFFPPEDADVDVNLWLDALSRIRGLRPDVVVPGHGALGGVGLVEDVDEYLRALARAVVRGKANGLTDDELVAALESETVESHPDWREPNWVESEIRSIALTGFRR